MSISERKVKVNFLPLTSSIVPTLLTCMCEADREEITALTGKPPSMSHLIDSIEKTYYGGVVLIEGGLAFCWGLVKMDTCSAVWMLSTKAVAEHPATTLRVAKQLLDDSLKQDKFLVNMTTSKNKKAIKLLKRLGATFMEPIEINNTECIPFYFGDMINGNSRNDG